MAAYERALGGWLAEHGVAADEALALDGRTLRGILGDRVPGVHLVAAVAHRAGAVLGQEPSPGKGRELAAVQAVLGAVNVAGWAVTGDALLTQRAVCAQVVAGQGDYLLPVDANQPALLAACAAAFSPVGPDRAGRWGPPAGPPRLVAEPGRLRGGLTAATRAEPKARHGRQEVRMLWALAAPDLNARAGEAGTPGEAWPHLAQVCRVERQRIAGGTREVAWEVTYAVTSLPPDRADAGRLLALLRGHWGIENRLHWVRDVTFDEDRSQVRTGAASGTTAACRNLAIALLRRAGHATIAAACRTYAGRPAAAVAREVMK